MALTTNLISYYKLDSNSNDSLWTNNWTDTSVSYVSGKISNAASYNGTTSKTDLPLTLNPTAQLTIAWWINSNSSSRQWIFVNSNGTSNVGTAWSCELNTTAWKLHFTLAVWGSASSLVSSWSISTSSWYHVAFVYDWSSRYIYINWSLDISGAFSGTLNTPSTGNTIWWYGSYGWGLLFSGLIDEVWYWDRWLSWSEVSQLYNSWSWLTYPFTASSTNSSFLAFI